MHRFKNSMYFLLGCVHFSRVVFEYGRWHLQHFTATGRIKIWPTTYKYETYVQVANVRRNRSQLENHWGQEVFHTQPFNQYECTQSTLRFDRTDSVTALTDVWKYEDRDMVGIMWWDIHRSATTFRPRLRTNFPLCRSVSVWRGIQKCSSAGCEEWFRFYTKSRITVSSVDRPNGENGVSLQQLWLDYIIWWERVYTSDEQIKRGSIQNTEAQSKKKKKRSAGGVWKWIAEVKIHRLQSRYTLDFLLLKSLNRKMKTLSPCWLWRKARGVLVVNGWMIKRQPVSSSLHET